MGGGDCVCSPHAFEEGRARRPQCRCRGRRGLQRWPIFTLLLPGKRGRRKRVAVRLEMGEIAKGPAPGETGSTRIPLPCFRRGVMERVKSWLRRVASTLLSAEWAAGVKSDRMAGWLLEVPLALLSEEKMEMK
jgi:hypothetical protein